MLSREFPRRYGGVVRRSHLIKQGYSPRTIQAAAESGRIKRIRYGWYGLPDCHAGVEAAIRSGAVVSCVSALSHHGVWTPVWFDRQGDHVHARRTEYRQRQVPHVLPNVLICASPERDARSCQHAVDSVEDALVTAIRCQSDDWLVVLFESVLQLGFMGRTSIERLAGSGDTKASRALARCGSKSESGAESITKLGFRRRRIRFRQQVRIGRDRVDFLIGERLIVEVDGEEFHSGAQRFEEDRARDRRLVAAGYIVVRLTYWQVMRHLEAALDDICRIVARGDHTR
ncbi:DUF559 domain-containing protein [uncultured Agrococcus sp.]|uniref:DUF559 domain-containing protein n=1 Tax=uncultured Agrococcus sp. TaxID=382258 RepID=UPI00344DEBDB